MFLVKKCAVLVYFLQFLKVLFLVHNFHSYLKVILRNQMIGHSELIRESYHPFSFYGLTNIAFLPGKDGDTHFVCLLQSSACMFKIVFLCI